MAGLLDTINNDLKQAMKEKKVLELSVLRLLVAALKNKKIEIIGSEDKELTDEQAQAVVASEIKKRKDSILAYEQGGRSDLAEQEKNESEVLARYLPAQLSSDEIEEVVRKIVSGMGEARPNDFGRVMGLAMKELKGKADGQVAGEMVKKILSE